MLYITNNISDLIVCICTLSLSDRNGLRMFKICKIKINKKRKKSLIFKKIHWAFPFLYACAQSKCISKYFRTNFSKVTIQDMGPLHRQAISTWPGKWPLNTALDNKCRLYASPICGMNILTTGASAYVRDVYYNQACDTGTRWLSLILLIYLSIETALLHSVHSTRALHCL